jgi:hypothetical protein
MIRRIFALAALTTLLVLSTLFSTGATSTSLATTAAPSCGSACVQNLNFCKSTCNGNPICLAQCQEEYDCCQIICHGGTCRQGKKRGGGASAMNTP